MLYLFIEFMGGFYRFRERVLKSKGLIRYILELIYKYYLIINGSYIPLTVVFKKKPIFPHGPKGVFISGDAEIGSDCVIFQHVTIGSNTLIDSNSLGYPKVGNNVLIGVGAKIIGNVNVGNNCRIGANSVVSKDVPENNLVVFGKQKNIIKNNIDNSFYSQRPEWCKYKGGCWEKENDLIKLNKLNSAFKNK